MTYARPSPCTIIASQPVRRKIGMAEEVKYYRDFYENHGFSVTVNPQTGEADIDVRDKS